MAICRFCNVDTHVSPLTLLTKASLFVKCPSSGRPFGNGPGGTLPEREVLSLARVQPDPLFLAILREGLATPALKLKWPIPTG
jgi:hypothetical protein